MRFDTFIFDLDGTLVDSAGDLCTAVNRLRKEMGLPPLDLATVRSHIGDGSEMLVRRSLPDDAFSGERLKRFLDLYRENLAELTLVYPGIREFLTLQSGRKMAVVTNKPLVHSLELLEKLDLSPFFSVVIGGGSCPEKKPHPEPVLKAMRELGAHPASTVMIGDHHTDLLAGRGAGLKTCFCTWGIGTDGGVPHDFRASSPGELASLFPREGR